VVLSSVVVVEMEGGLVDVDCVMETVAEVADVGCAEVTGLVMDTVVSVVLVELAVCAVDSC
jgi:hypothetical protein